LTSPLSSAILPTRKVYKVVLSNLAKRIRRCYE